MNKIQIKKGDVEILLEGDTKFIEKHLTILKKEMLSGLATDLKKTTISSTDVTKQKDKSSGNNLLSLFEAKKPSTHYDKIALFGYYLSENGKETFYSQDLQDCYKELRKITKMPGNLESTINDTIKYTGYIKRGGKKSLELTPTGTNYVLHQLPATTK